eukprot:TRINITY_DN2693_c0_g1_i1.p1 TRINITY_DN2693_c0_g1~~TRINITY_DN2693_c0_g1_i1.p1  ORF type:complete len:204 (-),score=57.01 TRINITY_DN2693_c0_g1_i1:55-666(-)
MAAAKCNSCGKSVYAMEQVIAVGKPWHKACLKCKTCGKILRDGNWNDTGGQVYCNHCYEKNFVDDETKQLVADMENTYAKKVHGTAKALPGFNSAPPKSLTTITNVGESGRSPPPPRNDYGGGSDVPAAPRRALPSALNAAILSSGGGVKKSSSTSSPPPPMRSPPAPARNSPPARSAPPPGRSAPPPVRSPPSSRGPPGRRW